MSNTRYYDFKTLRDKNYFVNFVFGIINDGKTFGAQNDALERFLQFKEKSLWVRNYETDLEKDVAQFKSNLVLDSKWKEVWQRVEVNKKGCFLDGVLFLRFIACSQGEQVKGPRDKKFVNLYFDEFNSNLMRIRKRQGFLFNTLIGRFHNLKKIFLLGNALTLATPLTVNYNILKVDGEWTYIKGRTVEKLILVHIFKRSKEEIEDKYKGNPVFELHERSNYASHAYYNDFYQDNLNNIIENVDTSNLIPIVSYKVEGKIVTYYPLPQGGIYADSKTDNEELYKKLFAPSRKDSDENIQFNSISQNHIYDLITNPSSNIYYSSLFTKKLVYICAGIG